MTQTSSEETSLQKENGVVEKTVEIDGGYGWVVVFASFLLGFSTWGLNAAFGIYFSYYLNNDVFEGGDEIDYAAVGGIAFGIGILMAPLVNYLQGLIGTRTTIIIGGLVQFASSIMASFAVNLWQLYLTQGLLQSLGMALIGLPALTLISQWFVKRRVFANALGVSGSGAGGLFFTLAMQKLIEVKGYQWALRAQAIIAFGLVLIAATLIKTKEKHHKVEFTLYDMDCLKCVGFWLLCFYLVTCIFGYVVVLYSLANYTTSLGYTEYQGSIVAAMVQVSFCWARPAAGFIGDIIGSYTVASGSYIIAGILCLAVWIPVKNYAGALLFALFVGIFMGSLFPTVAAMTARLVGLPKLNVAFCMSWIFVGMAGTVSDLIGVSLTSGSVDPSQYTKSAIFAGVAYLVSGLTAMILRGYVIARDRIIAEIPEEERPNQLHVRVPPLQVFQCILTWPKKGV